MGPQILWAWGMPYYSKGADSIRNMPPGPPLGYNWVGAILVVIVVGLFGLNQPCYV